MSVTNELKTEGLTETTEATSEGGVAASLGINAQLFVFQLINFAIVAVILWFLILKPLTKKMAERKKMIDESVDNVKAIETSLQMSEKKFQEKVDEAKVEANKIVEKAYEEGEKLTRRLKEKTAQDIDLLVKQAKKNIDLDKQEMKDEIRKETATMIVMALEKVFEKKLDNKMDDKFIQSIMTELEK